MVELSYIYKTHGPVNSDVWLVSKWLESFISKKHWKFVSKWRFQLVLIVVNNCPGFPVFIVDCHICTCCILRILSRWYDLTRRLIDLDVRFDVTKSAVRTNMGVELIPLFRQLLFALIPDCVNLAAANQTWTTDLTSQDSSMSIWLGQSKWPVSLFDYFFSFKRSSSAWVPRFELPTPSIAKSDH